MPRVKTFADLGSLLPADLNAIQDDISSSFIWRPLVRAGGTTTADLLAGFVYVFSLGQVSSPLPLADRVNVASADGFPLGDPTDFKGRRRKCRLKASVITNSVAPGVDFYVGLHPVPAVGGGPADSIEFLVMATTSMGGSTALIESPPAGSITTSYSGEFPMPQRGFYMPAFTVSGSTAAGSRFAILLDLEERAY